MARRLQLNADLAHYLESGCYLGAVGSPGWFDVFVLAGHVMRPDGLADLRAVWTTHGRAVKAMHPGETFAEATLLGNAWERRCDAHGGAGA
jgi:hypothetical protein